MNKHSALLFIVIITEAFFVALASDSLALNNKIIVNSSSSIENTDKHIDVQIKSVSNGVLSVVIPLVENQHLTNQKVWTMFVSISYIEGLLWKCDKTTLYAGIVEEKLIPLNIKLPLNKGLGWFSIRIEGENHLNQESLIVYPDSIYLRKDKAGNAGYELLVNANTGTFQPVPQYNDNEL